MQLVATTCKFQLNSPISWGISFGLDCIYAWPCVLNSPPEKWFCYPFSFHSVQMCWYFSKTSCRRICEGGGVPPIGSHFLLCVWGNPPPPPPPGSEDLFFFFWGGGVLFVCQRDWWCTGLAQHRPSNVNPLPLTKSGVCHCGHEHGVILI